MPVTRTYLCLEGFYQDTPSWPTLTDPDSGSTVPATPTVQQWAGSG